MMFSQCKPNQPVTVGPVGQSFTPGPVGPSGMVSNCKRMDQIAYTLVGSTGIPDPVEQTESPIQKTENSHDRRAGELGQHSPFK